MSRVLLLVGTKKGAFILESDAKRESWDVRGPFCGGWETQHVNYDPTSRSIYAAGMSNWFGTAVWRSRDFGETWAHSSEGITYGDEDPKITKLWNVTAANGSVYVGVEPAGLFRSDDGGESFTHVKGLRDHPTRPEWQAGGGGLCLHTIVPHDADPQQMWVAASAVGTFYTADGGETWETRNKGLRNDYMPPEVLEKAEIGFCVHKMAMAPGNPQLMYQQNHYGVYRSGDGGRQWQWINEGLPSTFGFPIAVHPHEPNTIYVIPLGADSARVSIGGSAAVWRSRDGGASWERKTQGLPQSSAYLNVLREGMSTDSFAEAGIYFGTTTGQIFASRDNGDTWSLAADFLPPIASVEAVVVED